MYRHTLSLPCDLPSYEVVGVCDKVGRRAVAKGADAVDEERLGLLKNGRHRIGEGSCDRIAVQPPARLRLASAECDIARHYPRCFTHRRPFTNRPQALTDSPGRDQIRGRTH